LYGQSFFQGRGGGGSGNGSGEKRMKGEKGDLEKEWTQRRGGVAEKEGQEKKGPRPETKKKTERLFVYGPKRPEWFKPSQLEKKKKKKTWSTGGLNRGRVKKRKKKKQLPGNWLKSL